MYQFLALSDVLFKVLNFIFVYVGRVKGFNVTMLLFVSHRPVHMVFTHECILSHSYSFLLLYNTHCWLFVGTLSLTLAIHSLFSLNLPISVVVLYIIAIAAESFIAVMSFSSLNIELLTIPRNHDL